MYTPSCKIRTGFFIGEERHTALFGCAQAAERIRGAIGSAGGPRSHLLGRPSCERAFFSSPGEERENSPKFGLGVCVEVPSAVCPSGMMFRVGAHHREGGGGTAESYGEATAGSLFCG